MLAGTMWGLFTLASLFVGLRVYARMTCGKLWYDDTLMGLGWVCSFLTLGGLKQN